MIRVVVIEADGSARVEEIEPVLSEWQRLVGGYIELVRMLDDRMCGYVNEEGLLKSLPLNSRAMELCDEFVVGALVVYGPVDDEGDETSIAADVEAELL